MPARPKRPSQRRDGHQQLADFAATFGLEVTYTPEAVN